MNYPTEQLKYISSYTSKLLRQKFGRGPELCFATAGGRYMVLYIKGFISPMEEVLYGDGHRDQAETARKMVVQSMLAELKGVIQATLDLGVQGFYHDWNFPNNRGMITVVFEEESFPTMNENHALPTVRDALVGEVARISKLVEKTPEHIEVYQLDQRYILVERRGILLTIEKALIQKGYGDILYLTKLEQEKNHFHKGSTLASLISEEIMDIFIDWYFPEDKSIILIVTK